MSASFAARVKQPSIIVAPGVYDLISVRLADRMGFDALYMTGYGTVASAFGLPDAGLATYTEMVDRVGVMANVARTPLICDGDTGYGALLNIERTVRGYERAGAAAIQIEDQEFPKKCGHTMGRRVVPTAEMVRKIKVAVEARDSADFLIVARTDARTTLGLDEALRRGEAYAKAGADVLFIESPETEEELRTVGRTFDVPLLANMVERGRTPVLTAAELQSLGFRIAIFPASGFLSAALALENTYASLRDGRSPPAETLYDFPSFHRVVGFEDVWAFDRAHADEDA
jgi:2-methylisocitrate lyase-like PEP mutase family enzyme